MNVFHCPECPLIFQTASELEDHLAVDHPDFKAEPRSSGDAVTEARRRAQAPSGRPHESSP